MFSQTGRASKMRCEDVVFVSISYSFKKYLSIYTISELKTRLSDQSLHIHYFHCIQPFSNSLTVITRTLFSPVTCALCIKACGFAKKGWVFDR